MATAYDTSSKSSSVTSSPASWTHTPIGTPTDAVVQVTYDYSSVLTGLAVTYGGTSMGSAVGSQISSSSDHQTVTFHLVNPKSGAQTVSVSWTGGTTDGLIGTAVTFTGGGVGHGTYASASGSTATPSVTVTGTTNDIFVDGMAADGSSPTTTGTNQTSRNTGAQDSIIDGVSTAPGVASQVMSWSVTSGGDWCTGAVSIKGASGQPYNRYLNMNPSLQAVLAQ
jgi:hypothetical protein